MTSAPPRAEIPTFAKLPLVIETPRLRMRPLEERDVEDLWPQVSNPALMPLMSWAAHTDRAETLAFIANTREAFARGTDITWAIEHEGRASGVIGLHGIQFAFRAWRRDCAELGYWLAIPLWNKGLMSEAATAVTNWSFETLGLHKLTVSCLDGNVGSQKVIERVGFRYLCKQEDDVWRDGRWYAHLRYELLASEWGDTTRTLRFSRPRA
jgi:[ribosomal protein S5]-alanine N-acetyltransferase